MALLALFCALGVSFLLTPSARCLATRCGCLDYPDKKRKLHATPIPYFGGLSIFTGFAATCFLYVLLLTGAVPRELIVILIGAAAICLVGLWDDFRPIPPLVKLLCQILVSAWTAWFGFTIDHITLFGHEISFGILSEPITVLWLVAMSNAVNLIDGLDGLACGVTIMESFALFVTAVIMGEPVFAIVSAALCGACLGFLPFNFAKASIFMGDAGALMIGYVMGCISVAGLFKAQALFSIIVPAMIFALPVLETVTSFFRRIFRGKNPFSADHKHLHYVLIENGFTPTGSVIVLMSATALFCIASVLYIRFKPLSLILFLLTVLVLCVLRYDKRFLSRFFSQKDAVPAEQTGEPIPEPES